MRHEYIPTKWCPKCLTLTEKYNHRMICLRCGFKVVDERHGEEYYKHMLENEEVTAEVN